MLGNLRKFLPNFASGLLLGAILSFALAAIIDSTVSESFIRFYYIAASAILTLIAASLALTGVLYSVSNQNRIAEQSVIRGNLAARSLLPIALDEVSSVAMNGVEYSVKISSHMTLDDWYRLREESPNKLKLEKNTVDLLADFIRHNDGELEINRRLSKILRDYQVQFTRWKDLVRTNRTAPPSIGPHEERDRLIKWISLQVQLDEIFGLIDDPDYDKRGKKELRKSIRTRVLSVLKNSVAAESLGSAIENEANRLDKSFSLFG